jgi:hypothetical protein
MCRNGGDNARARKMKALGANIIFLSIPDDAVYVGTTMPPQPSQGIGRRVCFTPLVPNPTWCKPGWSSMRDMVSSFFFFFLQQHSETTRNKMQGPKYGSMSSLIIVIDKNCMGTPAVPS